MWARWTLDCVFHPFNDKDHFTKTGLLPIGRKRSLYLIFRCNQLSNSSRSVFPDSKRIPFSFYNYVWVKIHCLILRLEVESLVFGAVIELLSAGTLSASIASNGSGAGQTSVPEQKPSGRMGVLQQRWAIPVHGWVCVLPFVSFWREFRDMLRSALSWRNRRPSDGRKVHFLCQWWRWQMPSRAMRRGCLRRRRCKRGRAVREEGIAMITFFAQRGRLQM